MPGGGIARTLSLRSTRSQVAASFRGVSRLADSRLSGSLPGCGERPLWHDTQDTPEDAVLRHRDSGAVQRLVTALAEPFRETFVLREVQNLSYREIAEIVGAPVGTVMSRLARARAMLRSAWLAEEEQPK